MDKEELLEQLVVAQKELVNSLQDEVSALKDKVEGLEAQNRFLAKQIK